MKCSQIGLPQKVISDDERRMLTETCVTDRRRACHSIEGVGRTVDSHDVQHFFEDIHLYLATGVLYNSGGSEHCIVYKRNILLTKERHVLVNTIRINKCPCRNMQNGHDCGIFVKLNSTLLDRFRRMLEYNFREDRMSLKIFEQRSFSVHQRRFCLSVNSFPNHCHALSKFALILYYS